MKNAIALIAVAGLAGAASAQQLSITASGTTFDTSGGDVVFTLSVSAVAGSGWAGEAIAGGLIGLDGSGDNASVVTNDISFAGPAWNAFPSVEGGLNDDSHDGFGFGQLIFPPLLPNAASLFAGGDVFLGSFTVTVAAGSEGALSYSITQAPGAAAAITTYDSMIAFPGLTDYQIGQVLQDAVTVNFVPAPSALAMLGLGGLVAGRRRR